MRIAVVATIVAPGFSPVPIPATLVVPAVLDHATVGATVAPFAPVIGAIVSPIPTVILPRVPPIAGCRTIFLPAFAPVGPGLPVVTPIIARLAFRLTFDLPTIPPLTPRSSILHYPSR